jgi:hypothetical protein
MASLAPPEAHYLAVEDGGLRADFLRERSGEREERLEGVSVLEMRRHSPRSMKAKLEAKHSKKKSPSCGALQLCLYRHRFWPGLCWPPC